MRTEKSCGAIIIENNKVLLIQQTDGFWGFPKGHVEENETEEQTAIREVKEETNLDVKINTKYRYQIEYKLPNGNEKIAVFFLAKPLNTEIIKQEEEISTIEWIETEKVEEKLSFENTREAFRNLIKDMSTTK